MRSNFYQTSVNQKNTTFCAFPKLINDLFMRCRCFIRKIFSITMSQYVKGQKNSFLAILPVTVTAYKISSALYAFYSIGGAFLNGLERKH